MALLSISYHALLGLFHVYLLAKYIFKSALYDAVTIWIAFRLRLRTFADVVDPFGMAHVLEISDLLGRLRKRLKATNPWTEAVLESLLDPVIVRSAVCPDDKSVEADGRGLPKKPDHIAIVLHFPCKTSPNLEVIIRRLCRWSADIGVKQLTILGDEACAKTLDSVLARIAQTQQDDIELCKASSLEKVTQDKGDPWPDSQKTLQATLQKAEDRSKRRQIHFLRDVDKCSEMKEMPLQVRCAVLKYVGDQSIAMVANALETSLKERSGSPGLTVQHMSKSLRACQGCVFRNSDPQLVVIMGTSSTLIRHQDSQLGEQDASSPIQSLYAKVMKALTIQPLPSICLHHTPPWSLRLAEIYQCPPNWSNGKYGLEYATFWAALTSYSKSEQRLGR